VAKKVPRKSQKIARKVLAKNQKIARKVPHKSCLRRVAPGKARRRRRRPGVKNISEPRSVGR
jgi:hypothetical protein